MEIWIIIIIKENKYRQCVEEILNNFGKDLILRLLKALAGGVNYGRIGDIAEVFETLYKYNKKTLEYLMKECIQQIPVVTEDPSKEEFFSDYFHSDPHDRPKIIDSFYKAADRYWQRLTF